MLIHWVSGDMSWLRYNPEFRLLLKETILFWGSHDLILLLGWKSSFYPAFSLLFLLLLAASGILQLLVTHTYNKYQQKQDKCMTTSTFKGQIM